VVAQFIDWLASGAADHRVFLTMGQFLVVRQSSVAGLSGCRGSGPIPPTSGFELNGRSAIRLYGNDVSLSLGLKDRNILYAPWIMRGLVGIFHVVCERHWMAEERDGICKKSRFTEKQSSRELKRQLSPTKDKWCVGAGLISNGVTQLIGPAPNSCLYSLRMKVAVMKFFPPLLGSHWIFALDEHSVEREPEG